MTPITLPTITCTRLEADRAVRDLFGGSVSAPAEGMEAGRLAPSHPASTLIRAVAFGIAAMIATACVVLAIKALVEIDRQIAWGIV